MTLYSCYYNLGIYTYISIISKVSEMRPIMDIYDIIIVIGLLYIQQICILQLKSWL